jgi:hypothetical protein
MVKTFLYPIVVMMCLALGTTETGAKLQSTKIEENQTAQLRLKSDSKVIATLTGPGVLSYYYERDKDAKINPPKGYKKAEIPDKSDVMIEKFEGGKRKGKVEEKYVKGFYYQFISGAWDVFVLDGEKACYITKVLSQNNTQATVDQIDAPATIYYMTFKNRGSGPLTEVTGYKLLTANKFVSLAIIHDLKSYTPKSLKDLVAVLYPIQGTGSPSASVATRPSRRPPSRPRTSSGGSNRWRVKNAKRIKDGPPY